MKVKISEATETQLDWLVAECEGFDYEVDDGYVVTEASEMITEGGYAGCYQNEVYSPSTDWAQGGPIIERERIDLFTEKPASENWTASIAHYQNGERLVGWRSHQYGPTPLIAAMRCYVASKRGDEVHVPDALS